MVALTKRNRADEGQPRKHPGLPLALLATAPPGSPYPCLAASASLTRAGVAGSSRMRTPMAS